MFRRVLLPPGLRQCSLRSDLIVQASYICDHRYDSILNCPMLCYHYPFAFNTRRSRNGTFQLLLRRTSTPGYTRQRSFSSTTDAAAGRNARVSLGSVKLSAPHSLLGTPGEPQLGVQKKKQPSLLAPDQDAVMLDSFARVASPGDASSRESKSLESRLRAHLPSQPKQNAPKRIQQQTLASAGSPVRSQGVEKGSAAVRQIILPKEINPEPLELSVPAILPKPSAKLVSRPDSRIRASGVSIPAMDEKARKAVPDAELLRNMRIGALFNHLRNIQYDLILFDVTVFDWSWRMIDRMRDDILHTRLRRHLQDARRFISAVESAAAKARERQAYYRKLQVLDRRLLQTGVSIERSLKELAAEHGGSGRRYSYYLKCFHALWHETHLYSHVWRGLLRQTIRSSGDFASDPRTWDHLSITCMNREIFNNYRVSICGVANALEDTNRELLTRPTTHTVQYRWLVKGLLSFRSKLLSIMPGLLEFERASANAALQKFYLSKPRSSIYWRQIDILAPFQKTFESLQHLITLARTYLRVHYGHRRTLARLAIQARVKEWAIELREHYVPAYQTIYTEFVELNWIRLLTEETAHRLEPRERRRAVSVAYPSLGADPARFYQWVGEISEGIFPTTLATPAYYERPLPPAGFPFGGAKRAVRPAKRRGQQSNRRPIRYRITYQWSSRRHAAKPKDFRTKGKSNSNTTISRLHVHRLPTNIRHQRRNKGGSGGGVTRLAVDSAAVHPSSATPATQTASFPRRYWSHRHHTGPDGQAILVHYCTSLRTAEQVAQNFASSGVIGLDIEWKPGAAARDCIGENVSVIQLANRERIGIFHIALFKPGKSAGGLVPPTLKKILESPNITKVGVCIRADCTRLQKYLSVTARGLLELSHLYRLVKYHSGDVNQINKRTVNLALQVEEHLGLPLNKDAYVRNGDWTRRLNYRQVQYAATDAYACLCLFEVMNAKRQALQPTPPLPASMKMPQPIARFPVDIPDPETGSQVPG